MALLRGPKLLNTTIFESGGEDWLLGCLLIFASTFCWSIWLILQVCGSKISAHSFRDLVY
jgi:hypothetical protein